MRTLLASLISRRLRKPSTASTAATALEPRYQRRLAYRHHHGQTGVEPTRFGDWEYNGRCTDFF